ncbi:peptidoglycan-binding domain-containing protein [Sinorhizobium sp. RAC02]|uniref:peptidoglycan-binding domain-containing protein n=1 Tax=Sinorhizobium sp. RAC02 TaxID=1842534 RepID=UPI002570A843|nr:peptidoglycan-binding domain-containing protein [Sinorhizobium sp. RAC02]
MQERLIALGYYLGPTNADGVVGRNKTNAIVRFQLDKGLSIKNPGSVGPKTLAALGLDPSSPALPWVSEG